jgi:hypothetical protein
LPIKALSTIMAFDMLMVVSGLIRNYSHLLCFLIVHHVSYSTWHLQSGLQHTQRSLDRVGANLAAIHGVLSSPNNTHSTLAAQYQALLQERAALQQLYEQLVAEGEAAGTRLELLLSATRARQQQQQQQGGAVAGAVAGVSSAADPQQQQQQQRRDAARRLLLGGSSSSSSSPTAAGRGGISQLLIPNSSSSSRPVSVAPPTGRLPAAQRPPTPDRCDRKS